MKNSISFLLLTFIFSFFYAPIFAVNSNIVGATIKTENLNEKSFNSPLTLIKAKKEFKQVLKKKKKKKKKKKSAKKGKNLTRNLLISWISTLGGGILSVILFLVIGFNAVSTTAIVLAFLFYILFLLCMVATSVLFIIWLVKLLSEA